MTRENPAELEGFCALVTGGANGIGLATARLLVARGARVALADKDPIVHQRALEFGLQANAFECDIARPDAIDTMVERADDWLGGIKGLAHCAAIFPSGLLGAISTQTIDEVLDVNLAGTLLLCQAAMPRMIGRGRGSIVTLASGAALRGIKSLSLYGASKAGVIALSRTLALEAAPHVRVNVVAPGTTASEAALRQLNRAPPELRERVIAEIPMGRLAEPEEIAEAICFLLSDRARFVTGATLTVNGGSFMP